MNDRYTGHAPTTQALVIDSLHKRFASTQAIDSVGFGVSPASLTVLLGPAGAGKTTALRLIAGLDEPDSGSIRIDGRDVAGLQPRDRDVAMIFDNLALYPNCTGFENIASSLLIRRVPHDEIKKRVDAMAATLRITHVLRRQPKSMSGGERQRVALGRALIRRPGLCLLDEPLSSLDALLRLELRAELKRLQREHGYTFLLATPDYTEALALADSVVMLRRGRVVQISDAQSLYDLPVDREAARFVGSPEINLVAARIEPGDGTRARVAGGVLDLAPALGASLPAGTSRIEIGLRPEHLRLVDASIGQIRAEVIDIEPLGMKSTLTVRNDSAELRVVVEAKASRGLAVGDLVGIDARGAPIIAFDTASGLRLG